MVSFIKFSKDSECAVRLYSKIKCAKMDHLKSLPHCLDVGILPISALCTLQYFVWSPAFWRYSWVPCTKGHFLISTWLTPQTALKLLHHSQQGRQCFHLFKIDTVLCAQKWWQIHRNLQPMHSSTVIGRKIKPRIWPIKWDICKPLQQIM